DVTFRRSDQQSCVTTICSPSSGGSTPPPGGLWNSPANGATLTIGGFPRLEARAYPTNPGGPAITHVAFTIWWPGRGPESGPWLTACDEYNPSREGVYGCNWSD